MSKKIFVFTVCGEDKHIQTLNFALSYIRHFTKNEVLVVTDSKRNNIPIEHDKILDIATPKRFSHHQASIYLKTGLFKIIEGENQYCYLDSDIIAMNEGVDEIFKYKSGPVTFASDHCRIDEFSPYAINCGCMDEQKSKIDILECFYKGYTKLIKQKETQKLQARLSEIKTKPFSNLSTVFRYLFFRLLSKERYFHLDREYKFDKKKLAWFDPIDNLLIYNASKGAREIESQTNLRFKRISRKWVDENGSDVYGLQCRHLRMEIKDTFGVTVKKKKWIHWNGGVFLFDKNSVEFLKFWHDWTMKIFANPKWKTRDQGTLIAAAWKFGLQNQPRLPQKFNFIADYYDHNVVHEKNRGYSANSWKTVVQPSFIHVYHEFGNQDWEIWQSVEETLPDNLKNTIHWNENRQI